jgi:hypothetical protein
MVQNPATSEYVRRAPWRPRCCEHLGGAHRRAVLSFREDAIGIRLPLPNPPPLAVEGRWEIDELGVPAAVTEPVRFQS